MKVIKVMNDFVLGIMMICVSAFLLFGPIVKNVPKTTQAGLLARADVWIKMLAVMLLIVAIILVVKSINFKKQEAVGLKFILDNTIVYTVVGLIVYTILLPELGFLICTFALTFFYVVLYTVNEQGKRFKSLTKDDVLRIAGKGIISSAVLLLVFWLVFAKLLAIKLPEFQLFM